LPIDRDAVAAPLHASDVLQRRLVGVIRHSVSPRRQRSQWSAMTCEARTTTSSAARRWPLGPRARRSRSCSLSVLAEVLPLPACLNPSPHTKRPPPRGAMVLAVPPTFRAVGCPWGRRGALVRDTAT